MCMPRAQVYAALNAIGEVAWSINGPVVDALKHAWDEGMRIGNMPIQEDLPLTPTPPQRIFAVQSHTYPRTRMTVSVSAVPSQRILSSSLCLVIKLLQGRPCSHGRHPVLAWLAAAFCAHCSLSPGAVCCRLRLYTSLSTVPFLHRSEDCPGWF